MKIKNFIFFALTGIILSGIMTIGFITVFNKEKTTRLIEQNQVQVPETYTAASISKGAILSLLVVGVIGVLGVSRKKKDIGRPAEKTVTNKAPDYQNLN